MDDEAKLTLHGLVQVRASSCVGASQTAGHELCWQRC